jgi:hypothetical protein
MCKYALDKLMQRTISPTFGLQKWTGLPLDDKKKEVKQLLEKKRAWFGLR